MNPINNRRAFLRNCAVLGAVGAAGILLPGCEKRTRVLLKAPP